MEINFKNIPMAIIYFVIGVFINIVFYYIFSPSQADLIGIMAGVASAVGFTMETTTTGIIWIGIMAISILVNILYPVWMIVDTEESS